MTAGSLADSGNTVGIFRYTIPNSFTAASLLLGLTSIVTGQLGNIELAGWMIIWCALLDVMDGVAARLLKATSSFGAEFDSMADLVSFGVAPGMLVFQTGVQIGGVEFESGAYWVLLLSVGVFVLCGAMRLARFNLTSGESNSGWFAGIPTTAAGGGIVATTVIVLAVNPDIAAILPLHAYLPVLMFVLALGMISRIRYPKATRRKSFVINAFQIFVIVATVFCGVTMRYPEFLFFMALFLIVSGIIAGRITKDSCAKRDYNDSGVARKARATARPGVPTFL
jgi:CDP-diacylglycerol--serine O-phosphatidyltransferase